MDREAGWWTTSGNIGLPPLARVMGVGRQQGGKSNPVETGRVFEVCLCLGCGGVGGELLWGFGQCLAEWGDVMYM